MKRTIATLSIVAASVALLAGCATVSGSSGSEPKDLTNPSVISALCGADAASVEAIVAKAADANPTSGLRHTLTQWGITDPSNDKAVASIQTMLNERAKVKDCTASTTTVKLTDDQLRAIAESMTIHKGDGIYACAVDTYGNVQFQIGSKLPTPDSRKWPDAISTPIVATDLVGARTELQDAICKDPLLGSTWLTFMATDVRDQLLQATGIDLLKLNPELESYTDISKVKSIAEKFDPLEFVKNPTSEEIKNAITQNAAWQQDAALVNTLLERFMVSGIEARPSLVNYHLVDYSLGVNSFANVGVNDKQESLPALIFTIVEKGQCGEITSFGANTGDKRPELFGAKVCETPPTTLSTTPPTTTTPGCTSNCAPTTCTVPQSCLTPKDHKNDVTPPQGWTPLGPDPVQPTAPSPKLSPLNPATPVIADPGPSVPVQGATPAPAAPVPAPTISQAPAPVSPGTSITDPDNG